MRTLSIEIPDETAAKLERVAEERGVTVDELLREAVDATAGRSIDFSTAADVVLEKNAELYRRLS